MTCPKANADLRETSEPSRHPEMTPKTDNDDEEDFSSETIVAPPTHDDDEQLYDNDVQTFAISPPEAEVEEEEQFVLQKFLATRRGKGGGGGGGYDRSKSLPSVHANGGVSYRLLGRRNYSGFGGLLDKVLEHVGGSDYEEDEEDGELQEEEDEEENEIRPRTRSIRYVHHSMSSSASTRLRPPVSHQTLF